MADTKAKASSLNQVCYGPPILPASHSYHRPGRGSSSCCCGPCCLLTALLKLAASIVIPLGIIVLVLWLLLRPHKLKAYVNDASLSQFTLTNSSALSYSLSLNLTLANPNRHFSLDYRQLNATLNYADTSIGSKKLRSFHQGHRKTSVLPMEFAGQNRPLGKDLDAEFEQEKKDGYFRLFLKVSLRLKLEVWSIKTNKLKAHIGCDLKLPLSSGASTAAHGFNRTKCSFDI